MTKTLTTLCLSLTLFSGVLLAQDNVKTNVKTPAAADDSIENAADKGADKAAGLSASEPPVKQPAEKPAAKSVEQTIAKGVVEQTIEKGVAFLRAAQSKGGSWSASPRTGIGPSTMIIAGLLEAGVAPDDPMLDAGLKFLEASTRDDGGVYTPDGFFQNYETCCAVMCFAKANEAVKKKTGKEPYKDLLAKADKFLRKQQYTEDRETKPEDANYGGVGYGGTTRPDLSNTQFFLDALKAGGAKTDDPAIQKALVFVSRCQNLESEHNKMPFVAENSKNLDGGFIYVNQPSGSPARGPSAGESKEEAMKSYGSMTYAGLKSMAYAGLTKEDKRVKAAFDWLTKHYTVTENPGKGAAGLFYYYHSMAKALSVLDLPLVEAADGKKHDWRKDLTEQLVSQQKEDGSWTNEKSRQYMENDPNLATGYALLVLGMCRGEDSTGKEADNEKK